MQASAEELPRIRLALGDDFERIQRQSTYQFPRKELGRIDIIAADKPVIFEYTRPECGFTLPPALSFGAAVDDGHAVSATVSPQLRYIPLNEALLLAGRVSALLQKAGWKRTKQYASPDQTRAAFQEPNLDSDYTVRLENWKCGDDEIYIELARHWRATESLPQFSGAKTDLYVMSVKIENDRVREKYPGR